VVDAPLGVGCREGEPLPHGPPEPQDVDLLGELVDLWEDGKLDTWTLVLVRHGRAVKRSVWNRPKERDKETDEATRPLTHDQGETRARALAPPPARSFIAIMGP